MPRGPRLDAAGVLQHVMARGSEGRVAVGMPVTRHPPHRSVLEALPHTAPTSGQDAEAFERIRMINAHWWKPRSGKSIHPFPSQVALLTAACQCLPPHPLKGILECVH